jgi:hypothetical protein
VPHAQNPVSRILVTADAEKIANKLNAVIVVKRRIHNIALIYHEKVLIAQFGIRRGSADLGHDHIPRNIFTGPRDCRLLAQCPMSREQWIELMKKKGIIEFSTTPQPARSPQVEIPEPRSKKPRRKRRR